MPQNNVPTQNVPTQNVPTQNVPTRNVPTQDVPIPISVVIPTCDRKAALLSLLGNLDRSDLPLLEVIIVDSGNDRLAPSDYSAFGNLNILYHGSERSVCIQRNTGIAMARAPWVFLLDDDVEMPPDYLRKLSDHLHAHAEAGAVSGLFLQQEGNEWTGSYPVHSKGLLLWKFIFGLGFWGEIRCSAGKISGWIKKYYEDKGNHISRSGWPVLVDFSGPFFHTPVYTLGAALVKKDWLLHSPFDEQLDRHGIGDNYGVCMGFPGDGVQVLTEAFVYHHRSPVNRLQQPLQYLRRVLAIDYFSGTKTRLRHCSRIRLLWSLLGNLLAFLRVRDGLMIPPACKALGLVASGRNPYKRIGRSPTRNMLRIIFIFYLLVSGYTMMHHEPWDDEVHSWNIAKASGSYSDLIRNTRYEGHPPAWYSLLWIVSKFTHNVAAMQSAQWAVACAVVFLLVFLSSLPVRARMLIPFGYFFLFEYGVISRNYALGVLFACCICLIIRKDLKYRIPLYYTLLFCLSNVHILTVLLAASLHLYFLLLQAERKKKTNILILHALAGALLLLPAVYFAYPPADSAQNMGFMMRQWNLRQLTDLEEGPLRAFMPIPAWWKYNFWNTQFLLEARKEHNFLKIVNLVAFAALLALSSFVLWRNKKSLALFLANLGFTLLLSVSFFALHTERHSGFIYIGFIVAWWLYCDEKPVTRNMQQTAAGLRAAGSLLILQLAAGIFAVTKDIRLPFSNLNRVTELMNEVPANGKIVTDYWTMNAILAFTDKPAYCIDLDKELSFITWNGETSAMLKRPSRYSPNLSRFFNHERIAAAYMVSLYPPALLNELDPQLSNAFTVGLIDRKEGSIENGSNVYLYKIQMK